VMRPEAGEILHVFWKDQDCGIRFGRFDNLKQPLLPFAAKIQIELRQNFGHECSRGTAAAGGTIMPVQ